MWFLAILLFSNAKSGYSAKQLERDLNVTYKTAWRMLMLIRKAIPQGTDFLSGEVEMDETYFGGRFRSGKGNRLQREAIKAKSVIVGAVERKGSIRAKVSPNEKAKTIGKFLDGNINPINTRLMTDESNRYNVVARGYNRETVNHRAKEYVRGDVYTNTIESFWGHLKRSVRGTHKFVSKKHLQSYVDGFVFHYNTRHNDSERFSYLLNVLLHA
jgi:transposase-like protein